MILHRNIHKNTWTSSDGKTHNQIDHMLVDRRWHLTVLYVQSFRGADCDTDHYLFVAKVRERLVIIQQADQKFVVERNILRKLNELEVMKRYQIKVSYGSAALEDLSASEDTNRAWENIKENIKRQRKRG